METVSVVTIAKNEARHLDSFLKRVSFANEIIVVDNDSVDSTIAIAQKYTSKIFHSTNPSLGFLKNWGLSKTTSDWVLLLDVDELVSSQLQKEIQHVLSQGTRFDGFEIPYQNHFLGHALHCQAQQYAKIRFFRKNKGVISSVPVHEEVIIRGTNGKFHGKILHYSFRTLSQVLSKFTRYARVEGMQLRQSETVLHPKHLTLYPLHMFWAVFITGQGYRDGVWGLLLASCFGYYEWAKYFFLWMERNNIYGK